MNNSHFKLHYTGLHTHGDKVGPHAHNYMELIYVFNGECSSELDGKKNLTLHAASGQCMIIPPYVEHDQTGSGKTLFMVFSPAEDVPNDTGVILDLAEESMLKRWLEDLVELNSNNPAGLHKLAPLLAELIWRAVEPQYRQAAVNESSAKDSNRIANALKFITNNYHHQISAHDIAVYSRSSITWLNLAFNTQFNCSLMHYVMDFRIKVARQMLNNDYLSLDEIAERCGFSGANYFIRVFRKYCGCTPGDFRKQLQEQRLK